MFRKLAHGEGAFPVRYPHDGRHVEANLTKQVLAEIEPGGKVRKIYTTSSGKPSTPTVVGRFTVYEKTSGVNTEGMVDSNYFIRGYAIHGYAEVPTYAASHGCLRMPIPDAPSVYAWVKIGTPVDVYDQGGGGSTTPGATPDRDRRTGVCGIDGEGATTAMEPELDGARERLVAELREHALVIGEVTLTSGRKAQYYVDAKRAILLPEGFRRSPSCLPRRSAGRVRAP